MEIYKNNISGEKIYFLSNKDDIIDFLKVERFLVTGKKINLDFFAISKLIYYMYENNNKFTWSFIGPHKTSFFNKEFTKLL